MADEYPPAPTSDPVPEQQEETSSPALSSPEAGGQVPEAEQKQAKIDKAADSENPEDALAALAAPTPAIPGRPETSAPPANVVQRQQAGLQPLPTGDELKELEIDGEALLPIIEKMYWVADEAGEPRIRTGLNQVSFTYPDNSVVIARFELRSGDYGALGPIAAGEAEGNLRNQQFNRAKELRDQKAEAGRKAEEENAPATAPEPAPGPGVPVAA